MRKLFLLFLILLANSQVYAKGYIVCSVSGTVSCANGQPIKLSNYVDGTQEVVIGAMSQLSLLDESGKLIYHLSAEGAGTIERLLAQQSSITKLTERYLRAIKDQMVSKSNVTDGRIAGGYRGQDEDILFVASLCKLLDISNLSDLGEILTNTNRLPLGDYLVKFDLISYNKGDVLQSKADRGDSYHISIKNYAGEALYVAAVSVDRNGKIYLLHNGNSGRYLLPGMSEVDYKTPTINFANMSDRGGVIVFATDFPVDFENIFENIDSFTNMNNIENAESMKVGIAGALIEF